jgi:hypothetical protein
MTFPNMEGGGIGGCLEDPGTRPGRRGAMAPVLARM